MSGQPNLGNSGPFVAPDLRALFDTERRSTLLNCNKVAIGVVQAWDPDTQSSTVQIAYQRAVYNTPMDTSAIPPQPTVFTYPLLVQVPTWVLSGGGAFIGMPIAKGDVAIVLFCDRDIDVWWEKGTIGALPNSARIHSLSDAIAIVGLRPSTTPVPGLPSDGVHMTFGNEATTLLTIFNLWLTATQRIIDALTALNTVKTGGDASAAIATAEAAVIAAGVEPGKLLQ